MPMCLEYDRAVLTKKILGNIAVNMTGVRNAYMITGPRRWNDEHLSVEHVRHGQGADGN